MASLGNYGRGTGAHPLPTPLYTGKHFEIYLRDKNFSIANIIYVPIMFYTSMRTAIKIVEF